MFVYDIGIQCKEKPIRAPMDGWAEKKSFQFRKERFLAILPVFFL